MKNQLRLLAIPLLLASAQCFGASSFGKEAYVEAAQCKFNTERDGVFWQGGRYTKNYMTPACVSFGFAGRFKSFWNDDRKYGWRAGMLVTGNIQNRDNVATYYDDEAGQYGNFPCNPVDGRGCMDSHNGTGNLRGFAFSLTRHDELGRHWSLIPELGLLFYRMSQDNRVVWQGVGRTDPPTPPGDYLHNQRKDILMAMPNPFFGLTLRYRDVYAFARHYEGLGGRGLTLTDGTLRQFGVGYAKQF